MKIPLIVVILLVAVDAHQGWPFDVGYGRGNKPGRGPWAYPQQQSSNNLFDSDVQWVCQNPKTNDLMIIATDNTQRDYPPGRGPWQWHPPGHQGQNPSRHHQHQWTQPIIIEQEPTSTNNNNNNQLPPLFPQTSETPNNNNNNNNYDDQSQTTPRYHGGEGLIDIRIAP